MNQLDLDQKPLPPPHTPSDVQRPPQLTDLPSFPSLDPGLSFPLTPTTPVTPSSSSLSSPESKPKKSNPLNDLIDTEKIYVDQLTGIIRKIAAAWSRSNLPPPDLDVMFRSIEGIYKANRALHSKLKELGTNPSSPKALGDLLMRWIDDLNGPYTTYCTRYRCGFDTWDPVQSNPKLANIIATFSASNPPPSAITPNSTVPPMWTLDDLFLLPKARLKYYKKLYSRLLKSTIPGRSDHRLLMRALETLDNLLATLEDRNSVNVGNNISPTPPSSAILELDDQVVIDLRTPSVIHGQEERNAHSSMGAETTHGSESSSTRDSSLSGGERLSRETATTSISRMSSATLSMPLSDLERRLSTDRTLDIFTMQPKAVRLQIAPPSLTFTRELRLSMDVAIHFTPQTTGVEIIHALGHIFLLSDLFLICERILPEERPQNSGLDGPDMWLCYPPLSGKVLRVFEVPDQPNTLKVTVRKESLFIQTESTEMRNFVIAQLRECIEFAGILPPPSKQPPPPVPSLNGEFRPHLPPDQNANPLIPERNNSISPPNRSSHAQRHESTGLPPQPQPPMYQNRDVRAVQSMPKLVLSPEAQVQLGAQRSPSIHNPLPGPTYPRPRTSSSTQQHPNGPTGQTPIQGEGFGQRPPSMPGSGPSHAYNPAMGQRGPFQQPNYQRQSPHGLPPNILPSPHPPRPPSEPGFQGGIRKSASTRSLASQYSHHEQSQVPPIPSFPGGHPNVHNFLPQSNLPAPQPRLLLPSLQVASRSVSTAGTSFHEPSPPGSPVEETPKLTGPVTSTVSAQMKCKVFLQQQHAQWKSLGSAKLKLYRQDPTNIKQLVVEADNKERAVLISTIVLTDGVERVGKTGVAIELSDKGARTGIIYMIQLRNETSAGGLFDSLLAGSDRATRG